MSKEMVNKKADPNEPKERPRIKPPEIRPRPPMPAGPRPVTPGRKPIEPKEPGMVQTGRTVERPEHHHEGGAIGDARATASKFGSRTPMFQKHAEENGNPDAVRFVPLGGLEEVGRNCMFLEYKNEIV